jgi:hypothetical protein
MNRMTQAREVLVNTGDWDGPPTGEFGPGEVIVNAPRPLAGPRTWTGEFRHGVFYASGDPDADNGRLQRSWDADDAWPVVFTTNAAITEAVTAKLRDHGYTGSLTAMLDESGCTVPELAAMMELPWHEDA